MINRFGLLGEPTKALFGVTHLKLLAQSIGIEKLEAGPSGGAIRFGQQASVDAGLLVRLVHEAPLTYSLDGPFRLRFKWSPPVGPEQRIDRLEQLLGTLGATAGRV